MKILKQWFYIYVCPIKLIIQIIIVLCVLYEKKNVFYRYKDTLDDRADIAIALLAAAKANHVNIIDIILRKDDAFQDERKSSVLHVLDEVSHFPIWKVAVFEGLSCIFEV